MIDVEEFIDCASPLFELLLGKTYANNQYTPFNIKFMLKKNKDGSCSVANPVVVYGEIW